MSWGDFVAAERERIDRERREGLAAAEREGRLAFEACHAGETMAGQPVWQRAYAPWDDVLWEDRSPSTSQTGVGAIVRLGTVALAEPGPTPLAFTIPLVGQGHLIFEGSGDALTAAHGVFQSIVFRLVASARPGKVRIIAIDPVGLGQTFADCLHLGDRIRGAKFWHEEREIDDALVELTDHLAMVFQKYLRNDYPSIDAYNEAAGEVAEPYRIVLIANFPAGFQPKTAQRLLAIAANGPKVGVQLLLTRDTALALPRDFDLEALRRGAVAGRPDGRTFALTGWGPEGLRVALDSAPPGDLVEALAKQVTEQVATFDRVEVPFEKFAPTGRWPVTATAADGIEIGVGRRGARETQTLRLFSSDTGPHVLVAGQTGSGKTVLLHVLITSLALHYSPDEVELYLVDFKEGVEFQPYRRLPHARVVAIQSEREFGVSVIAGIGEELERRGELFREQRVTSLAQYREAAPHDRLPRVVLLVDEFQVLFAGRDAIAREVGQLFDDIAKRGRAFGIHLVLATQTLSQFELEPSTLSQISIRIAMRMTEADSLRILGRDNDAARYLERPGEAIFNGHGGIVSRNVKFQVALIRRKEIESAIDQTVEWAQDMSLDAPIVFDGSLQAEAERNADLAAVFVDRPTRVPRGYDFHVGEPTTMRTGHVCHRVRRQSRGNVVVVGGQETDAFRLVYVGVAGLAAQVPRDARRLHVLNLTNVDDPIYDEFDRFRAWADECVVASHADVETFVAGLGTMLEERRSAQRRDLRDRPRELAPPVFVVLFGLQRANELRRAGHRPTPAMEQLRALLREGPDVGLHCIMWCDTFTNLTRVIELSDMADIGGRIALRGGEAVRVLGSGHSNLAALKPGYAYIGGDEAATVTKAQVYGARSMAWIDSRERAVMEGNS